MSASWLIVVATFLFATMGVCVKLASAEYSAGEIVLYRSLTGAAMMLALARWQRGTVATPVPAMHFWRVVCGVTALCLWFYSIGNLPLATAMTLNYMSSVWMALFLFGGAIALGTSRVDGRLIATVLIGFAGVFLILRPTIAEQQLWYGLAGLLSGVISATAYLQVTALGRVGEPEYRIVFLVLDRWPGRRHAVAVLDRPACALVARHRPVAGGRRARDRCAAHDDARLQHRPHAGERQPAVPRHRLVVRLRRAAVRRPRDRDGRRWHAAHRRRRTLRHLAPGPQPRHRRRRCAEHRMTASRFTTLIDVDALRSLLDATPAPIVLDASFDLADTSAGERAYAAGHIPGSLYVHLDRDLCAPKNGRNGRHPMPDRAAFARTVGTFGIAPDRQVVTLDRQGGMYAARLWWMLRWLGHEQVAVLDGGHAAWLAGGGESSTVGVVAEPLASYPDRAPLEAAIDAASLAKQLGRALLLDARSPERFRGEKEPIDPVAGHIPGALNRFHAANLAPGGKFKPPEQLHSEFAATLGNRTPADVIHSCGSGVTACHNLLAMAHAGLSGSRLYAGSWSEWSSDPRRTIARG